MPLPLIGFVNINNGNYFPLSSVSKYAVDYMMKNPDTFARKYDESVAQAQAPAAEEAPAPPRVIYSREELEAMLLADLKALCKERRITIGDANKEGVIELILAEQEDQ